MSESLLKFQELFNSEKWKKNNNCLDKILFDFSIFIIENNNSKNQEICKIREQINKSKIIVINKIDRLNTKIVIIFDQTIIFIPESDITSILDIINDSQVSAIFTSTKKLVPTKYQQNLYVYETFEISNYNKTIENFSKSFSLYRYKEIKNILQLLIPSISSYYINKSYFKHQTELLKINNIELTKDKYIKLQILGSGSSSCVQLIYHIELESLFALKIFNEEIDDKTFQREFGNYQKIEHPFIPKCYGKTKVDCKYNCIIMEYIRGKSLLNIKDIHLDESDKIRIILQMMLIFEYLRDKEFIYRDLKPDNVMIDQHKNLFLIDFNRMLYKDQHLINEDSTRDLNYQYICPEIAFLNARKFSYKNDIFSIGIMIYYIIFETFPEFGRKDKSNKDNYSFDKFKDTNFPYFKKICEECTETKPSNRPLITKLIDYFFNNLVDQEFQQTVINSNVSINEYSFMPKWIHFKEYYIKLLEKQFQQIHNKTDFDKFTDNCLLKINKIHLSNQYGLIETHYLKNYFDQNPNEFIQSFTKLEHENNNYAQCYLGKIYFEGKCIQQDINKSIHYFTLSANQNNYIAQCYLGRIYSEGKYIQRDINKSIHYFTLSANQNYSYSQYHLGILYFDGTYVQRNMNRSIHYFTLSANQNNLMAQYMLGLIYYDGSYIERDILKSIHYFTLSANQNNFLAQYYLGEIYYDGIYVQRDIDKSIHYFTLSANLNCSMAQFYLGIIYCSNRLIQRDINKSIHYLTLSANQNNNDAQFYLGLIYYKGIYIQSDINKSIHYFTLSANQNNKDAQFYLGFIYYVGKYIQRDMNKSIYYLTLSANQNNKDAQFYLGFIYFDEKYIQRDMNKSIRYFTLSANQNNYIAQCYLGRIYLEGKYIQRDINKSIHYFTLSANQNYSIAQCFLGKIYLEGKYIQRDMNKSIHYFTLSANQNNSIAQCFLGKIYSDSQFVPRDIYKSIYYLEKSSNQNNSTAQSLLGQIYYQSEYIKTDINKAIYYLELSANQNNSNAQNYLGRIYLDKNDITKGIHYLTLSSNNNNSSAQIFLGIIYHNCKYVKPNINKSIHYFTLAANNNNSFAQFALCSILYHYKKDMKKSISFLLQSVENEFPRSYFLIGFIYHSGKYIEKDINKAIYYYKKASSFNDQFAKNNIGIIYKNGFLDEIQPNLGYAITYFEEAINQQNDYVACYNLAHLYLYQIGDNESINKAIKLIEKNIADKIISLPVLYLFFIIKIRNFGYDLETIENEILKISSDSFIVTQAQITKDFFYRGNVEFLYEEFRKFDFLYDFSYGFVVTGSILPDKNFEQALILNSKLHNVTHDFYKGFNVDFD